MGAPRRRGRFLGAALAASLVASVMVLLAPAPQASATVASADGVVTYKEYWVPHTEFTGGCDSPPQPGGYFYIEPSPCAFDLDLRIPDDFSQALKAEVYLDLWRNRDVPKVQFRINGNAKHTPDVGFDWSRTPWVGEVPLTELEQGDNTLRFTSLFPVHVHDIAVRIYYDATHPLIPGPNSDVTPPTGALTSITADNGAFAPNAGGLLDLTSNQLSFAATASDNRGVAHVSFIGNYEGYDIDADGITKEWQATYRNNWNPGGLNPQAAGGLINHFGSDATAPYSVQADVSHIVNQSDVQFKLRIVDTSGNVIEAPGGVSSSFDLVRDYEVTAYTIDQFDDAFISTQDPEFPSEVTRSIELPDLTGVTDAFVLGNYWRNPRLSVNGDEAFRVFDTGEDEWPLSIREIPVSSIGDGLNALTWSADQGFGHFIERPGPMIVLHRDTGPPAPPSIVDQPADVAVSANMPASFSTVAAGSPPPTYQWQVNTGGGFVDIDGANEAGFTTDPVSPSLNGAQYRVVATNRFGTATSAPATLTVTPQPGWAPDLAQWPYRLEVLVGADGYERTERYARVGINFTELLASVGVTRDTVANVQAATFDPQSVRVVEIDAAGQPISPVLGYQWDQVSDYDAVDNADGNVVFPLEGVTGATETRRYHVYFATRDVNTGPLSQPNVVHVIDNVLDEGQLAYRVETPRASYLYQKDAGGFSSILDVQNRDWVSFDDAVFGAGGTFRGVPNAVFPEGSLHPGATDSRSSIIASGPLSTTIQTTTLDGRFGMRWEIYPTYVTASVTKALDDYWFLYEGTPGGTFSGTSDRVVRAPGIDTPASQAWTEDIPGYEWTYFSDTALARSLAFVHHEADNIVDSYRPLDGRMTVFGFGRSGTEPQLRSRDTFTMTLFDGLDQNAAIAHINDVSRDLAITKGFIERPAGATLAAAPTDVTGTPRDAAVALEWTAPADNGGAVIEGYVIEVTPPDVGPIAVSGQSTEAVVTGLTNGQSYTFAVRAVNAVGVGPASLPTGGITAGAIPSFVSDDFNSPTLGSIWEIIDPHLFDPLAEEWRLDMFPDGEYPEGVLPNGFVPDAEKAAEVRATGEELVIKIPGGTPHDLFTDELVAPRVLQAVPDQDFQVDVGFNSAPTERSTFQGFIAQQDFQNFVRVDVLHTEVGFQFPNGATKVVAYAFNDGTANPRVDELVTDGPVTDLRVTRSGDRWTIEFSTDDGATFQPAGTPFTRALDVRHAGLFAGNAAPPDLPVPEWIARFDYAFLTSSPIVPEDENPDIDPLQLTDVAASPSDRQAVVRFETDELATAEVVFGETTDYLSGSRSSTTLDFSHEIVLDGLEPSTTYHAQVIATDLRGFQAVSADIEFTTLADGQAEASFALFYGLTQAFGGIGQPQRWVNLLGSVVDPDGIADAYFTVNGGSAQALTIGDDDRRLEGDDVFNVEVSFSDFTRGLNSVLISIVDFYGNVSTQEVVVDLDTGARWPLPYTIDWSETSQISDVAQVVDGDWVINPNGTVSALDVGYDRILAIGDLSWTDYEVEVPVKVDSIDPGGFEFPSVAPAIGILMRWPGHYDEDASQPRWGFAPMGALGWYRFKAGTPGRLILSDGDGLDAVSNRNFQMQLGTEYVMKMRVQTESVGHRYTLTIYPAGQSEASGVTISNLQGPEGFSAGSFLLVAHHVVAEFGDVEVRKINPATEPTISPAAGTYAAGQTVSISSPDPSATIRYTLDGRPPTVTSPVYTGPFKLNATAEVRAIAIRDGLDVSGTATSLYDIRKSSPIQSDDFSGGVLDTDVWTFFDPVGDVQVNATPDHLLMDLPAGVSHNMWVDQLIAPRVMQYAPNTDFEIEAKFDGTYNGTFNMQGLLVQQTMQDLLRVDVFSSGAQRRVFVATFTGGKERVLANQNITSQFAGDVYLRIIRQREDHQFRVEWSPDGQTWNLVSAFVHPMAVTSVGFWTGNHNDIAANTPAMVGSIDYFFNNDLVNPPDDGTVPSNVAPQVDAGPDRSATLGTPITLNGSVTDDGVVVPTTTTWSLLSGPGAASISDPSALAPTVDFDEDGTYALRLQATDGEFTVSDVVEVTVAPAAGAPIVRVPASARVGVGEPLALDGSASDPDGLPGPLTVTWSKQSGPGTVTFANANAASTSAVFDTPGTYVLQLAADDGANVTTERVEFVAVDLRTRDGLLALYDFADFEGTLIRDVSLVGEPLDLHIGNLNRVTWRRDSLVIEDAVEIASHEPADKISSAVRASGELTVEAWVRPISLTQSGPARIVSVSSSPTARNFTLAQGPDGTESGQKVDVRIRSTATNLNGQPEMATDDVLGTELQHLVVTRSADGTTSVYVDGVLVETDVAAGATLSNWADGMFVTLANEYGGGRPWRGEYHLVAFYDRALTAGEVGAHFQHGAETVGANQPPLVSVTPTSVTHEMPAPLVLDGFVADDYLPTRNSLVVEWTSTGPAPAVFADRRDPDTTVTFTTPGVYQLRLTADDGENSAVAVVDAIVEPEPPNTPPTVDAGPDLEVEVVDSASIDATVVDDGYPYPGILDIGWEVVSGPGTALIDDPASTDITVNFSESGTYVLRLTADDGAVVVSDDVTIDVVDPPRDVNGLLALYGFAEGGGTTVRDVSGVGTPMDLTIQTPGAVTWGSNELTLDGTALITSEGPADKIISNVRSSGEITVEVWLTPADVSPTTAGRVFVIGDGNNSFNMVLSQGYHNGSTTELWKGKLRSSNGTVNPIESAVTGAARTHIVYTRDAASTDALLYVDGELVHVRPSNGDLTNWTESFPLVLGNELTGGYGFEGSLELVAFYSRSFDQATVTNNYLAGPDTQAPPTVDAGPDQLIEFGIPATMSGTAVDDGLPDPPAALQVGWVQQAGPGTATFVDPSDPDTSVSFDAPGTYTLRLEAYDGRLTSSDTVVVTVKVNEAPVVDAGVDVAVEFPAGATLTGAVTDDDLPAPAAVQTQWNQVGGPATATISSPSSLVTAVGFPAVGTYRFRLVADDGALIANDDVVFEVKANDPPVVDAGPDATVDLSVGGTLAGAATDDGLPSSPGTLSLAWAQVSGPGTATFADASRADTAVSFDAAGVYELSLTADDGASSAADTVTLTVVRPARDDADAVAFYGFDEGSGATATDTSGNGTPLDLTIADPGAVTWVSGGLRIDDPTTITSGVAASKIIDAAKSSGAISIETWVEVGSITPAAPGRIVTLSANASTRNITLGQGFFANQPTDLFRGRVTTTGGGTHPLEPIRDTDLHHVVYVVDTVAGRSQMFVDGVLESETNTGGTFANWNDNYELAVGAETAGALPWSGTIRLLAIHDTALSDARIQQNYLAGSGDQLAPSVDAGPNRQAVLLPPDPAVVSLDGTVTDDGLPDPPAAVTVAWSVVSGPGPVTFGDAGAVDTTASFTSPGTYVLALTADDSAVSSSDQVTVVITGNAAPTVQLSPTAATLFPAPVTLDGVVTDDGIPGTLTAQWSQVSGPGVATFVDPGDPATSVSFDVPGVYVLRLTADDSDLTASADIEVTSGSNQAPVVDAGVNFGAITNQPGSLDGTVTDDGLTAGPVTTVWSVDSGPGNVAFGDPAATDTTVAFDTAGTYVLRLTADDGDLQAFDTVEVTVDDPAPAEGGVVARYTFDEGSGATVRDTSGVGAALDLQIQAPANVTWAPGTLTIDDPTTIISPGAATKIIDAAKASGQVTIEAWVEAGSESPSSPGRVVSISGGATTTNRNITLGQGFFSNQPTDLWRARVSTSGSALHPFGSLDLGLQHVVLVLDTTRGVSEMWVDGVLESSRSVSGDLSTWNDAHPLILGSEPLGQMAWRGTYYEVTILDRALDATEIVTRSLLPPLGQLPPTVDAGSPVTATFEAPSTTLPLDGSVFDDGLPDPPGAVVVQWTQTAGPPAVIADPSAVDTTVTFDQAGSYEFQLTADDGELQSSDRVSFLLTSSNRVTAGLVSLYEFTETSGAVVADTSGVGTPADLTIDVPANVTRDGSTLTIDTAALISGDGTKFRTAAQATNEFTIEAWITPSNAAPSSPGWIAGLAEHSSNRNTVLSQGFWNGSATTNYESRVFTTANYNNPLGTAAASVNTSLTHLVYTRSAGGQIRIFLDGVEVAQRSSSGNLSDWKTDHPFVLGNDALGNRAWLGAYDLVALYDRALTPTDVQTNFALGPAG